MALTKGVKVVAGIHFADVCLKISKKKGLNQRIKFRVKKAENKCQNKTNKMRTMEIIKTLPTLRCQISEENIGAPQLIQFYRTSVTNKDKQN